MELVLGMTALSAETLSEHDLIDAARDGDDRAFEELYARYRGRITGFIHARVRDHGRSEDVAQEVFISALRRLRASSQEIQFKPWIYEIAKNACIDEYRRTRRAREVSLDGGDDKSSPPELPSRAPTPPAAFETKQRLTDLRGAFGGLSESHHQLLVLRELEGLSYDEIGARTGMSRQMVESALFRARRKLTEEYEELASGRRCRQVQSTIEDGRALVARSLGVRERRVFARHLAHCQPCRVSAHLAGVDATLVSRRRLGAKIAALVPLPLWRWPWTSARSRQAVVSAGTHPAVQTLTRAAEPVAATSLGGAAVAATVLALAGAGALTAPAGTRVERLSRHPAVIQPATQSHAAAPAVGHGALALSTSAPAHAHLQLAGEQASGLHRTVGRRSVRHSRRVRRTPGDPGAPAGTAARAPTGSAAGAPGAAATVTGPATSAPLSLTHTAGADLSQSAGGVPSPINHVAAGLPLAPISSGLGQTLSTGTRTTGTAPSSASLAAGGATQSATGASGQISGATAGAVSQTAGTAAGAVTGAGHPAGASVSQAAAGAAAGAVTNPGHPAVGPPSHSAAGAAAGAVTNPGHPAVGPPSHSAAGAAAGAVTNPGHPAVGPPSQTAAGVAAGATHTVAPLLPGISGP